MDPPSTDPEYNLKKFKQLVSERYTISRYTSTSYKDVGEMTPIERRYLIDFLKEEFDTAKENNKKLEEQILAKQKSVTNTKPINIRR